MPIIEDLIEDLKKEGYTEEEIQKALRRRYLNLLHDDHCKRSNS